MLICGQLCTQAKTDEIKLQSQTVSLLADNNHQTTRS